MWGYSANFISPPHKERLQSADYSRSSFLLLQSHLVSAHRKSHRVYQFTVYHVGREAAIGDGR